MKAGFRVDDPDTHIDPGADVLEKYVDHWSHMRQETRRRLFWDNAARCFEQT